jgi:SAM-dependent methyltransferase
MVRMDEAARWTRDERRTLGAWYTPGPLVDHVLANALDPVLAAVRPGERVRVLDPACGDGRFLAAAALKIEARGAHGVLMGVDVDGAAVAEARSRLGGRASVHQTDALRRDWTADGLFDAVVGNPPFLSQLASATTRGGRSTLGGGPYADAAAVFLALAVRLTRPGGRIGLVLPQSVLATRDAGPIRCEALARASLESLWWSAEPVFDASVVTCVVSLHVGGTQHPVRRWVGPRFEPLPPAEAGDLHARPTWSHLLADLAGIPSVAPATSGTLGDLATATADFRDQYYGLIGRVGDDVEGPPLITSGLIDPGGCAWGQRPARFARRTFSAPRVDLARLEAETDLGDWARNRLVPKVLLAAQTRVLEAVVDEPGAWLPSVPVVSVLPRDAHDLWRCAAVLSSPVASAWAAASYFGAGLAPAAIKLSASQVLRVPLPADPWDDAAAALRAGDLDGAAVRTCAAYRVEPEPVLSWWRAGVQRALTR